MSWATSSGSAKTCLSWTCSLMSPGWMSLQPWYIGGVGEGSWYIGGVGEGPWYIGGVGEGPWYIGGVGEGPWYIGGVGEGWILVHRGSGGGTLVHRGSGGGTLVHRGSGGGTLVHRGSGGGRINCALVCMFSHIVIPIPSQYIQVSYLLYSNSMDCCIVSHNISTVKGRSLNTKWAGCVH